MDELKDNVTRFSDNLYVLSFDYTQFSHDTVVAYMRYLTKSLEPARVIAIPVGMNLSYLDPISIETMKEFVCNLFKSYGEEGIAINSAVSNLFGDDA